MDSSDGESATDSESLNSEQALTFVQGTKKPPILVMSDRADDDDEGSEEDDESEGDDVIDEDSQNSDEEASNEVCIHIQPMLDVTRDANCCFRQNLTTRTNPPGTKLP